MERCAVYRFFCRQAGIRLLLRAGQLLYTCISRYGNSYMFIYIDIDIDMYNIRLPSTASRDPSTTARR